MDFSGTIKRRKRAQMCQKLPSLQVIQCVFPIGTPLILSLTKNLFLFDKLTETLQIYLSFTL